MVQSIFLNRTCTGTLTYSTDFVNVSYAVSTKNIFDFFMGYAYFERAVGKNEKLESFKLESLELENFAEVGKFRCSWKVLAEVGKLKVFGRKRTIPTKADDFFSQSGRSCE